jgi:hypothetical protein
MRWRWRTISTCGGRHADRRLRRSRFSDRVEFYDSSQPRGQSRAVPTLLDAVKWCDDTTQTVGVYPESPRERILDTFSLAGCSAWCRWRGGDPMKIFHDMHTLPPGMPHDGIEPMRRNVRWVIDHRPAEGIAKLSVVAA